ncbi:hypothetical protein LAZ67_2003534 [Cordylochernes scorpioides]|uniref:Reverse transcriptase domain-containing protein n=1 Tax=Cordylochernes scorpioides TaxID=51811 RepID=A0ABY6K375_9ARAC|nr:hypothetical protein LAZ67_2003534 [Cordylochernes scorpioides]
MLEHGIITTSVSPYASPITLVTKRDKSKRFCVDYRRINEIIAPDVHPLPLIENILDKLSRAKYFSSADISSAYWQVEIDPSSQRRPKSFKTRAPRLRQPRADGQLTASLDISQWHPDGGQHAETPLHSLPSRVIVEGGKNSFPAPFSYRIEIRQSQGRYRQQKPLHPLSSHTARRNDAFSMHRAAFGVSESSLARLLTEPSRSDLVKPVLRSNRTPPPPFSPRTLIQYSLNLPSNQGPLRRLREFIGKVADRALSFGLRAILQNIVKRDLEHHSYRLYRRQALSEAAMKNRLDKAKKFISMIGVGRLSDIVLESLKKALQRKWARFDVKYLRPTVESITKRL